MKESKENETADTSLDLPSSVSSSENDDSMDAVLDDERNNHVAVAQRTDEDGPKGDSFVVNDDDDDDDGKKGEPRGRDSLEARDDEEKKEEEEYAEDPPVTIIDEATTTVFQQMMSTTVELPNGSFIDRQVSTPGAFAISNRQNRDSSCSSEASDDEEYVMSGGNLTTSSVVDEDATGPMVSLEAERSGSARSALVVPNAYAVEDDERLLEERLQSMLAQRMKRSRKTFWMTFLALVLASAIGLTLGLVLPKKSKEAAEDETQSNDNQGSTLLGLQTTSPPMEPVGGYLWTLLGQRLYGEADNNWFGFAVSLSANASILAVGAVGNNNENGEMAGQVRVFVLGDDDNNNDSSSVATGEWVQLGQDMDGRAAGDNYGVSVALSSNGRLVVAAGAIQQYTGASGYVRMHRFDMGVFLWVRMGQDLEAEGAHDFFGVSVALSANGTVVAVGGDENDGNGKDAGHVRVYDFDWEAYLWIQRGDDLEGGAAGDWFGRSVALSADGDILAVGAMRNSRNGMHSGQVRVYHFSADGEWVQKGHNLDGEAASDFFGRSLDLSDDGMVLAAGAFENRSDGDGLGYVRVFSYNSNTDRWDLMGQTLEGEEAGDAFGTSVALSSDGLVLAIGADESSIHRVDSGYVRTFAFDSATLQWVRIGQDLEGEVTNDWFGYDVALSANGQVVASGGRGSNGNGEWSGQVRSFQLDEV